MSDTSINGRKKCLKSLDKIRIIKIIVSLNIIFFLEGLWVAREGLWVARATLYKREIL